MNATTHLIESCDACHGDGRLMFGNSVWPCTVCSGTGRRLRSTHDPRSAIDYTPGDELADLVSRERGALPSPERWARIRSLAAVCRDASNSGPISALLDEVLR